MLPIDNVDGHQLSTQLEGQAALLEYELQGSVMNITHTRVPPQIRGRGVAAELMRSALHLAAVNGWTVKPVCAYAIAYMQRHSDETAVFHREELLDEAIAESFPASDPPAVGGAN